MAEISIVPRRAEPVAPPLPGQAVAVSNCSIDRPTHFMGRDVALADIAAALARDEGRAVIVAPRGLRGVGKTTLAAVYAERHRAHYRATWWIRAQTRTTMRADLVALGVRLGWVAPDAREAPALAVVIERLRQEGEGLLLIYDNAADSESLRPYLPRGTVARVLVTSDVPTWRRLGELVEIGVWPTNVGADYLMARTGREAERVIAENLSNTLGGLPLAHALAAAFCERRDLGLADYAGRLAAIPVPVLDDTIRATGKPGTRPTLARSVALAIEEAAKLHPAAEFLIVYAAVLAPEPIPLYLFADALEQFGQPLRSLLADEGLGAAVAALHALALVERAMIPDERDPAITTESIRVHRLVGEAATARCANEARRDVQRKLIKVLATVYPSDVFNKPATWPRARRLDPLASAVVAPGVAIPPNVGVYASHLLDRLALYRQASLAAYVDARSYFERALALAEAELGRDHPNTATILNNLALSLYQQGDLPEARGFVERALFIREKRFGGEHFDTLASLTTLALLLQAGGNFRHAQRLFARVCAVCETVLGAEHRDTASCLNNLGWLFYKQGDFVRARPLLERALKIRETMLGLEHSETVQTLNNLALLLRAQGNLKEARPLHERDIAICEKLLGSEHPQTATALNSLARLLQVQGDLVGARPLFERTLEIRVKVFGFDHPETATSLNNLAFLLQDLGDLDGARPLFERVLEARETMLGPNHPETTTSLNNLAVLLQSQGDLVGARPLFERARDISDRCLGANHIHAQKCGSNRASLLLQMGQPAAARPLGETALHVHAVALGPEHPWTKDSARVTAGALAALGEAEKAAALRSTYDLAP